MLTRYLTLKEPERAGTVLLQSELERQGAYDVERHRWALIWRDRFDASHTAIVRSRDRRAGLLRIAIDRVAVLTANGIPRRLVEPLHGNTCEATIHTSEVALFVPWLVGLCIARETGNGGKHPPPPIAFEPAWGWRDSPWSVLASRPSEPSQPSLGLPDLEL